MAIRRKARPGDFLRVDDRTGFTHWASETQKEWTGAIVNRNRWEARHPQDFVRGVRDDLSVPDARIAPPLSALPSVGAVTTLVTTSSALADDGRHAPMGALGEFALGQSEIALLTSVTNVAGSSFISVASTRGMSANDIISVALNNSSSFITDILSVLGATTLQLTAPLPDNVDAGNLVVDFSAVTTSSLG